MPDVERQVLTAPAVLARAVSRLGGPREQRWMLSQPRAVRRSFAAEVLGRPDAELRQQAWMLLQPDEVRLSFVARVLERQDPAPREEIWMLRQPEAIRASYVREVLGPRLGDEG